MLPVDKVFKIVLVFALLMLLIVLFYRSREKKFHEYKFIKRVSAPLPGDPDWIILMAAGLEAAAEVFDREHGLVFSRGPGISIKVSYTDTGEELVTIPLEDYADLLIFDPDMRMLYSYSIEGMLTFIRQQGRENYRVMQHLPVPKEGRRMLLDSREGRIYLNVGEQWWIYGNG